MIDHDTIDLTTVFKRVKDNLDLSSSTSLKNYIPNITEYVYGKQFLNFQGRGLKLFPMQEVILKSFYRRQLGNENIKLTEEEINLLKTEKLDRVINKYNSEALFRELVLVLGRRCISEDMNILDPITGLLQTVGELWDANIKNINTLSLDEEDFSFYNTKSEIFYNGIKEVYKLELSDGRYIEATPNHPFLTIGGWKPLEELNIKDRIATPKKINIFNKADLSKHGSYSISTDKLTRINKTIKDHQLEKIIESSISWIPIKSITKIGPKRTFDISVNGKNKHNFVSNDIISHNSGKDFLTGIMASYEAMRLLEIPGGDPYKYYDLIGGNPIFILTIATSGEQAETLFNEIKSNVQQSQYFRDKIGHIETDKIWLLTPADKKHNKKARDNNMLTHIVAGSVVIMSGHSNSASLVGKGIFSLLFDEVASYKTTGGASSGERLYSALGPSTVSFKRPILDENGNTQLDENGKILMRLDSKIISISSPRGEEGILWKLYQDTDKSPNRLSFKLPTWKVNESITYTMLRDENKYMSAADFNMEFGAEFSGTHGEKFIKDSYVDMAIDMGRELGLDQKTKGERGIVYYVHLDPANSSHNYALVLLHTEERIRMTDSEVGPKRKEKIKLFVVDHIKVWSPSSHKSISVKEVETYILDLYKRFRIGMVSYDTWNSIPSIQKFRAIGIPCKSTPFRKQYKMFIYDQLEHLLINRLLVLPYKGPHAQDMELELKSLKRIYTPVGYKIKPDPEGLVTTDDLCFDEETMILMSDYSYKPISQIQTGEKVISSNGNIKKVVKVHRNNAPQDMYVVKPYYSLPMICTSNHPFETEKGFKTASNLSMDDKLIMNINHKQTEKDFDLSKYAYSENKKWYSNDGFIKEDIIKCNNVNGKWHKRTIKLTENFALLAGLYMAEGYCGHHSINFAFNITEIDLHILTKSLIHDIFGIESTFNDNILCNTRTIISNSQILKRFFRDLFGYEHAINKKIPQCFMESSESIIISLLKGIFYGDGSHNNKYITFTTTSINLASQIRLLLFKLGIASSITFSKRKGRNIEIQGRTTKHNSDLYNIRVMWSEHYNKLSEYFDLGLRKDMSMYHKLKLNKENSIIKLNIRKIECVPYRKPFVYNLEVEDDHTYIAQVNVHNCDSLAGVLGVATGQACGGYPKSGIVYLPQLRIGEGSTWRIGSGQYDTRQWNYLNRKFGLPGGS